MNNPYLGIIVTHYNEPWEIGRQFFDMMEHQVCVDMNKVSITLVQDGEENALPWKDLLSKYHYKVNIITIPHSGTASARNAALSKCDAQWVTFFDFDDSFADMCSLYMILNNLPTQDYDLIWGKIAHHSKWFTGHIYVNCENSPNFANTDGKLYRTQFLNDNNIRFPVSSSMYYEQIFNSVVLACVQPFRIVMLTTDFYPFFKTFRPDGIKHTKEGLDELQNTIFQREKTIATLLHNRGKDFAFMRTVAKAVCCEYYKLYCPDIPSDTTIYSTGFLDFYEKHRDVFECVSQSDLDAILSEAEVEQINFIQNYYNEHKQEYYFRNDNITFKQWLDQLNEYIASETPLVAKQQDELQDDNDDPLFHMNYDVIDNEPQVLDITDQKQQTPHEPRVVVYCGTYDVYMNMVASLKSVLCNIPVDKVYFICEDDVFPYKLPDIVDVINVKNQTYFPPDGPNFDNSWTYMCMIRAAFPQMFPQYSKILSLDIDIVVNDNVSDLWDYDLSDYYLAGVPERQRQKSSADPMYINFGVVMMNLDNLRRDNASETIIHNLNTKRYGCPEQDAYNQFCAGHILELPADYNYTTYSHITGDAQKERILHYAGQKFWRHYSMVKQYADLGWNEVMRRQNKLKEGET